MTPFLDFHTGETIEPGNIGGGKIEELGEFVELAHVDTSMFNTCLFKECVTKELVMFSGNAYLGLGLGLLLCSMAKKDSYNYTLQYTFELICTTQHGDAVHSFIPRTIIYPVETPTDDSERKVS